MAERRRCQRRKVRYLTDFDGARKRFFEDQLWARSLSAEAGAENSALDIGQFRLVVAHRFDELFVGAAFEHSSMLSGLPGPVGPIM